MFVVKAVEQYAGNTYVVPCGGGKLDRPAPAAELYVGSMFRHTYESACRAAELDRAAGKPARVVILSALHGLVDPAAELAPYDVKMGDAGSVTVETLAEQAAILGIGPGSEVTALLPRAYFDRLDAALKRLHVWAFDVYEGCAGIGEQKRENARLARDEAPAPAMGSDFRVWTGGDVSALWWGIPMLVSYGRLVAAKSLPVASAPWVCDSRGFTELAQHGEWTITVEQYAADLVRYADEIGQLVWAAPQDWPVTPDLLARTGLTEAEHQARTVAAVVRLRELVGDRVPVICVVTGLDAAGYLRHVELYRAAGIDLREERHPIGVGALVGRNPSEVRDILRALFAAGLRRMHGFGVKGAQLDQGAPFLESIDSAAWSAGARHRGGECPHGTVKWERNCPHAAIEWTRQQYARAVLATA